MLLPSAEDDSTSQLRVSQELSSACPTPTDMPACLPNHDRIENHISLTHFSFPDKHVSPCGKREIKNSLQQIGRRLVLKVVIVSYSTGSTSGVRHGTSTQSGTQEKRKREERGKGKQRGSNIKNFSLKETRPGAIGIANWES